MHIYIYIYIFLIRYVFKAQGSIPGAPKKTYEYIPYQIFLKKPKRIYEYIPYQICVKAYGSRPGAPKMIYEYIPYQICRKSLRGYMSIFLIRYVLKA